MKKRALGTTGLDVTPIGLGGFPFGGVNLAAGWDPFTLEGRAIAISTIHRAIARGINYLDTAPSYGNGHSESLFGEAIEGLRDRVVLATKCPWNVDRKAVVDSVEASLRRLRVDQVDLMQFHGGMFTADDVAHIVHGGPLDALRQLRDAGKIRFIGFTCEEPWTARPLIASGAFDVVQLRYNLIYQSAALHALPEARDRGMGVTVMRPLTSGILQRTVQFLEPTRRIEDVYALCLKFVLADSRVHVANVGMRWPTEVDHNVDMAEQFIPPIDIADMPRLTAGIYQAQDMDAGKAGPRVV